MNGTMAQQNLSERLLAHARLCQAIAAASWNEEIARELEQLARECERAAGISESFTRNGATIPKTNPQDEITTCSA
jgi:6,7-dimethyl-8-ribityllumazine synthase